MQSAKSIKDLLWQHYSNGKFGFKIQKTIYLETGNALGNYDEKTYNNFIKKIGWIKDGKPLDYEDIFKFINFNNTQLGRLPLGRRLKDDQFPTVWFSNNRSLWFSRIENC